MKLISLFLLVSMATVSSYAKEVILTVPDKVVSYESINENFDGSISIKKPTLWADGEYLPVADGVYGYNNSDLYTCILFGYSNKYASSTTRPAAASEKVAQLGYTKEKWIFLADIWTTEDVKDLKILDQVTCSKK